MHGSHNAEEVLALQQQMLDMEDHAKQEVEELHAQLLEAQEQQLKLSQAVRDSEAKRYGPSWCLNELQSHCCACPLLELGSSSLRAAWDDRAKQ